MAKFYERDAGDASKDSIKNDIAKAIDNNQAMIVIIIKDEQQSSDGVNFEVLSNIYDTKHRDIEYYQISAWCKLVAQWCAEVILKRITKSN